MADSIVKQPNSASEDDSVDVPQPLGVALLVDGEYIEGFGGLFGHMLMGLLDESVGLTIICPDPQVVASLPTGLARVIQFSPSAWPGRYRRQLDHLAVGLDAAGVNLIHACCGTQGNLACALAQQSNRPYVLSVTGLLQRECFWQYDEQRCRALIAISSPIAEMLSEAYPALADRVRLVRPGCYFEAGKAGVVPEHKRTIVSAGFYEPQSGYDVLLRALRRVSDEGVDFMAFIFGNGPLEHSLRRWTIKADIASKVTFLPPISRWQSVLADADVYVQPGRLHRLHGGPYEALARGCPIIATSDTAFDLVIDGTSGVIFPTGDEDRLVEVLLEWFGDPDKLGELSQKTIAYGRQQLSLPNAVSALLEIYREATIGADTARVGGS